MAGLRSVRVRIYEAVVPFLVCNDILYGPYVVPVTLLCPIDLVYTTLDTKLATL